MIANAPIGVTKHAGILLMAFASGVTTVIGQAILGLVELVTNPGQFVESMKTLASYLAENAARVAKIPQLMLQQIQSVQEQRNPFQVGSEGHTSFATGWYVGYATGGILKEVASGGVASVVSRIARTSSKLSRALDALGAAKSAAKAGVSMRVMATAGRINSRLPDVDVDTARIGNRLSNLPASARSRVVRNVEDLSDGTKRYLAGTDVANPGTRTARLMEATGAGGRKALDALSGVSRRASDTLLRMADDAAAQRAVVRAWERGDLSTAELKDFLVRYNRLDAADQAKLRNAVKAGDDAAMRASTQLDDARLATVLDAEASAAERAAALRTVDDVGVETLGSTDSAKDLSVPAARR